MIGVDTVFDTTEMVDFKIGGYVALESNIREPVTHDPFALILELNIPTASL